MSTNIPSLTPLRDGSAALDVPTPVTDDVDNEYVLEANDGLAFVKVVNSGMTAGTVTISPSATIAGLTAADLVISCPVGDSWLPVLPPAIFNDAYGDVTIVADGDLAFSCLRI